MKAQPAPSSALPPAPPPSSPAPAAGAAAPLATKAAAFLALVVIQVTLALVYKAAQDPTGAYAFDPAAILCVAELVKLALSLAFFARERLALPLATRERERAEARARAAAAVATAPRSGGGSAGGGGGGGDDDDDDDDRNGGKDGAAALAIADAPSDAMGAARGAGAGGGAGALFAELRETFLDQAGLAASSPPESRAIRWVCAGLAAAYCVNNQMTFVLLQWADGANVNLIKGGASLVSTLMLRFALQRRFSSAQWSAVCLQVCGLVVAQFGATCTNTPLLSTATYALLLLSLTITSYTSVVNDKVLKEQRCSLHVVNAVLYAFGVALNFALLAVAGKGAGRLFVGFDRLSTYPVLLCNALIGIAVTAVYKYTDATMKTFGSACATSVLMLINVAVYGMPLKIVVVMGCLTVFIATHQYSTTGLPAVVSAVSVAPAAAAALPAAAASMPPSSEAAAAAAASASAPAAEESEADAEVPSRLLETRSLLARAV
jgi:hypothetical protein